MESKGIDHKQVFYVKRVRDTVDGNYFVYSQSKVICNPTERLKFYLKVGGIVFAEKKKVPGSQVSTCAERFKESDYFGTYLYYSITDLKLRTVTTARRIGLPDKKLVSGVGTLHSVIPRYDGGFGHHPILTCSMRIDDGNRDSRKWTKFDGKKNEHNGFYEINENVDLIDFQRIADNNIGHSLLGIYVTDNTSLMMIDATSHHLFNDLLRDYNYTVFQSGALIVVQNRFYFKFYDIEESEMYTKEEFLQKKRELMPSTKNLDNLSSPYPIIFLKSAPNFTFWTLRVSSKRCNGFGRCTQLCIPTGGQFEEVFDWQRGVEEIVRRRSLKPWTKYISTEFKNNFVDINVNEAYPGISLNKS
jgi:hypothetical protein